MGGCVAATRTTKRHFELFKSECLRLLEEWGVLSEWRVEFVHEKLLPKTANFARNRMLRTAERILRRNG